jgi:hypothetical protein
MASKRRRTGNGGEGGRAGAGGARARRRIEHLRWSFAKFRRAHRPRTRIPQELRDEALGALRCGASELDVLRACRITQEQLERWRQRERFSARNRDLDEQALRVFPVVDDEAVVAIERTGDQAAQELELRIGGWAICIRQFER